MPGPSPVYIVEFDGQQLPGYVQSYAFPLEARMSSTEPLGMDGGNVSQRGFGVRPVTLSFLVKTRLGIATGLEHEEDCADQYAEAMAICARADGQQPLYIGRSDRFLLATFSKASEAKTADESSQRKTYDIEWMAQPWWYQAPISQTFSGNGTVTLTMPETRTTYPIFTIPSGVTAFTATHAASGKSLVWNHGAHANTITIDCAKLTAVDSTGLDVSLGIQNVDYGIKHTAGAGSFAIAITGFTGSGSVTVEAYPRLER